MSAGPARARTPAGRTIVVCTGALLDHDQSTGPYGRQEIARLGYVGNGGNGGNRMTRVPIIALTRRGDLKTKLAAFDRGVDDILTVPFSPEELLARALAIVRRTYHAAVALAPVVKVGELE